MFDFNFKIKINRFMKTFCSKIEKEFKNRVIFIGVQGSYGRGEEIPMSDIDTVVILDNISFDDLIKYESVLNKMNNRDKICGFIAGRSELEHWEPSDLFHLYFDTTPVKGDLGFIRHLIDEAAVKRAVKIGLCNIYHGCIHNMLHEKNIGFLIDLYKTAFFVIRAMYYDETGSFVRGLSEITALVSKEDKKILETYEKMRSMSSEKNIYSLSEDLFAWLKVHL